MIAFASRVGVALAAALCVGPQILALSPAQIRPDFSGTWMPADPAKSNTLFDVGLSRIPGTGRLTIEQRPNRFTVTITMPDERLDPYLTVTGRFDPTIIYRIYESGRSGGAGAAGSPVIPSHTSWVGDRLVIPNAITGAIRPVTMTFSMDGERLKMESRVEVDAKRVNNVTQWFTKVK